MFQNGMRYVTRTVKAERPVVRGVRVPLIGLAWSTLGIPKPNRTVRRHVTRPHSLGTKCTPLLLASPKRSTSQNLSCVRRRRPNYTQAYMHERMHKTMTWHHLGLG